MSGVKETKEALVGVLAVAEVIAKRLKDGVGLDDAMAIVAVISSDEEFKAKMVLAVEGYKAIPEELKDIDLSESVELMVVGGEGIVKIVKELRA